MQDTCHMNFVMNLVHRGVSHFSGGASERGIRRSEVRFYMGTRNFFPLSHVRDKTNKTSFSISLPSSKLIISLISINSHYVYAIDIADPCSRAGRVSYEGLQ